MHPLKPVSLLVLPLLLTACGDDLESRNAALGLDSDERPLPVAERTVSDADAPGNREPQTASATEADDGEGPPTVLAEPRDLVIGTEGFAPEPMDDATGFAPEPTAPEPFNPNPVPEQPAPVQRPQ